MKTLGSLKLNKFSKNELDQRKLNALKGGCDACGCGCGCDGTYGEYLAYQGMVENGVDKNENSY